MRPTFSVCEIPSKSPPLGSRAGFSGPTGRKQCAAGFLLVGEQSRRPPLLSKHQGSTQRRHPPWAPCRNSTDRHRWLLVLLRSDRATPWSRVRLRSSAQDSAEQSCHPSRAAREDRHGRPPAGCPPGVGRLRDAEHLIRAASQPGDSSGLGVLAPAVAIPRAIRRPAPRARQAPAVSLQLHPTAPSSKVRAGDENAGDAGRFGE